MKCEIDTDERWPFYTLSDDLYPNSKIIDIPEEFYQEYLVAHKKFEEIQKKLKELDDEYERKFFGGICEGCGRQNTKD